PGRERILQIQHLRQQPARHHLIVLFPRFEMPIHTTQQVHGCNENVGIVQSGAAGMVVAPITTGSSIKAEFPLYPGALTSLEEGWLQKTRICSVGKMRMKLAYLLLIQLSHQLHVILDEAHDASR